MAKFKYEIQAHVGVEKLREASHVLLPDTFKQQWKDIAQGPFQTLLKNRPHTLKGYVQSPLLLFQEAVSLVGKGSSNNQLSNLEF